VCSNEACLDEQRLHEWDHRTGKNIVHEQQMFDIIVKGSNNKEG